MAKSAIFGNGQMLIGLDRWGQVYDLYYPYVGHENHMSGQFVHKIGVWADNSFSWLDSGDWEIEFEKLPDTMVRHITARNNFMMIELRFTDTLYNERPVFLRTVEVKNLSDRERKVKVFFNQQFAIYESPRGDTAFYDPHKNLVVHYKGRRVFAANAMCEGRMFDDYSVGLLGIEGKEGTYRDAEDGSLSKNNIEHGLLDSVIGMSLELDPQKQSTIHYWLMAGKYYAEVRELNAYVIKRGPDYLVDTTSHYWKSWANKQEYKFDGLGEDIASMFKNSLLVIRSHIDDQNGSIIASSDSDLLKNGRDFYSYVWPRDGAFICMALDKAGYSNVTKNFFEFCNDVIDAEGFFYHKYLPDKSMGSSWHPWIVDGRPILPIQEDETALVINALWQHYECSKDLEFIEKIYNSLIRKATEFMISHIDGKTGLPKPSYDLWEEKFGTHTFTAAAVYGALEAAARFAEILGKSPAAKEYRDYAIHIKEGILKHLYDYEAKTFHKRLYVEGGETKIDRTIDMSSIFGIWKFGVLSPTDPIVVNAMDQTIKALAINTEVGGFCRYENDHYFRSANTVPGNPWIIISLWKAQYDLAQGKKPEELASVVEALDWSVKKAYAAGMLPEQLDPYSGTPLSATPLVWSHAEFVSTVISYLQAK